MAKILSFLLLILAFAQPAFSQSVDRSVYIEDLTWEQVQARQKSGVTTIIIPTGGTEQNGLHLAIGKHNRIVAYTAGEIARKLNNALVAPVLAYVPEGRIAPPEGHMKFTGTISVSDATLARVLEDAARSFKEHGFTLICFIGDHGGSQAMQQAVAEKLSAEWRTDGVRVINVSDYYAKNGQEAWVKEAGIGVANPAAHAGFFDTAELMAIDQRLVHREKIRPYKDGDYYSTGMAGDATKATPGIGERLLGFKISAGVNQIADAQR